MKWWPENCESGDMIRVKVGSVWHYGIFVSTDEVIEFGPPPLPSNLTNSRDHKIISVNIEDFSAGGIVEKAVLSRVEQKKRIPPHKTVELARSRIGEGGYDIIHNNCEHFATACVFGLGRSSQEEFLRQKWLNRPILDVYIMKIPEDMEVASVYPAKRDKLLRETGSEKSRLERYAVWKLLECAVKRSFSLHMEDINFRENKGKWSCDKLHFSLSHSHGAVAVAVSNGPCGVDIESMERFVSRYSDSALLEKFQKRLCSADEKVFLANPEDFIELWTKKECIYKCWGAESFFTRKINTTAHESITKKVFLPEEYVISFCGEMLSRCHVYVFDGERFRPLSSTQKGMKI